MTLLHLEAADTAAARQAIESIVNYARLKESGGDELPPTSASTSGGGMIGMAAAHWTSAGSEDEIPLTVARSRAANDLVIAWNAPLTPAWIAGATSTVLKDADQLLRVWQKNNEAWADFERRRDTPNTKLPNTTKPSRPSTEPSGWQGRRPLPIQGSVAQRPRDYLDTRIKRGHDATSDVFKGADQLSSDTGLRGDYETLRAIVLGVLEENQWDIAIYVAGNSRAANRLSRALKKANLTEDARVQSPIAMKAIEAPGQSFDRP